MNAISSYEKECVKRDVAVDLLRSIELTETQDRLRRIKSGVVTFSDGYQHHLDYPEIMPLRHDLPVTSAEANPLIDCLSYSTYNKTIYFNLEDALKNWCVAYHRLSEKEIFIVDRHERANQHCGKPVVCQMFISFFHEEYISVNKYYAYHDLDLGTIVSENKYSYKGFDFQNITQYTMFHPSYCSKMNRIARELEFQDTVRSIIV